MKSVVAYLLAQNTYRQYIIQRMFQVIVPAFLPTQSINLKITPNQPYGWILYEVLFGEAMIPHQFTASISRANKTLFDGVISGQLIDKPFKTFSMATDGAPLVIEATNQRNLVGHFEATFRYLEIQGNENYPIVMEDIQRMRGTLASVEGGV